MKENVLDAYRLLAAAVREAGAARRDPADAVRPPLILPDNSVRIAVLEIDSLPEKEEERRALIRFSPAQERAVLDVDEAALAWSPAIRQQRSGSAGARRDHCAL